MPKEQLLGYIDDSEDYITDFEEQGFIFADLSETETKASLKSGQERLRFGFKKVEQPRNIEVKLRIKNATDKGD